MTGLGFILLALLLVGFSVAVARCRIYEERCHLLEAELGRSPLYAAELVTLHGSAVIEEVAPVVVTRN